MKILFKLQIETKTSFHSIHFSESFNTYSPTGNAKSFKLSFRKINEKLFTGDINKMSHKNLVNPFKQ